MPETLGTSTADIPLVRLSAHRVIWLSEILDRIFAFNDVNDAARCARVCKAWKEKALDHVWFKLPGLNPLFRLLAPLIPDQTNKLNGLVFTRTIRPCDWVRAAPFLFRVKRLEMSLVAWPNFVFPQESAFINLLISRPETRILPNLKALSLAAKTWSGQLRYVVPLLHDRLEMFTIAANINIPGFIISDAEVLLEEIACRATKLRRVDMRQLEIKVAGNMDDAFSRFFASQASLEAVALAPGILTTPVLNSLSSLPKLRQIEITRESSVEGMDLNACKDIAWEQRDGESFPNLLSLDLHTRAVSVTNFIYSCSSFSRLKSLCIDIIFQNDAGDIQKCMEAISTTCGYLEVLKFTRIRDDGNKPEILNEETKNITKDTIAPLASFRFLKTFTLTHTSPIIITDDNLVGLLGRCAELTELCLNPCPLRRSSLLGAPPSLGVLHRIARCQPKLKHLALYLSAARFKDSGLPYDPSTISMPFEHLEILDLGNTLVHNVNWTAGYLSQILLPKCKLKYEWSRLNEWSRVQEMLPIFTRIFTSQRDWRKWASLQPNLLEEREGKKS